MLNLIPKPYKSQEKYGEFLINKNTLVYADEKMVDTKDRFLSRLEKVLKFKLRTIESSEKSAISFIYDRSIEKEGYKIDAESNKLTVYASDFAGGLYAVESLRQLLNLDVLEEAKVVSMHAVYIEDKPRYSHRGFMFDESRHFFGKDFVKGLLDLLAMHKLNVFHWHLTDGGGWRIEIKGYPLLTEIGSKRAGTQYLCWARKIIDNVPHSGFYTQEDIKEIVEYAAALNIMIIPEIDIPAHFCAALAAYPHLSCKGLPMEVPRGYFEKEHNITACLGKESTYKFIYDIIDELSLLFPAPYFHIGGDEVMSKKEWKECPDCQKVIKENNLKDETELHGFFNNKISLYLKSKGKTLIGWNEVLDYKDLDKDVIAQYWQRKRIKNVEEGLKNGRKVIMSKHEAFYFDMPYGFRNLKDTYGFEPELYNITDNENGILGVEAALWTEWVRTPERAEFQMFPRMEALAEVAWTSKENKDYQDFRTRLKKFLPILDKMKIVYAPESMYDCSKLKASKIEAKFRKRSAHHEFKRAMHKSKRDYDKSRYNRKFF